MKKLFTFFAAMLVALAVNAQTDFSTPYSCTADAGVISGDAPSNKVYLNETADPHQIEWSDVSQTYTAVVSWTFTATRACYVTVGLDLGTAVSSNKHIFEVKLLDAESNVLGALEEGPAYTGDGFTEANQVKELSGKLLIPEAGTYTLELRNNRNFCKGSIKNVILTFAGEAAVTDFATPYSCAADDAVLVGTISSSFGLETSVEPHYIKWADRALASPAAATWKVIATRGCYVSVSLDLGPVISSNKHIFEVSIQDANEHDLGMVKEPGENTDSEQVKALDGQILIPTAGNYTITLINNRDFGKGAIKNVILTYVADAPSEIIEVSAVELNKTAVTLDLEEVELLTATVSPENATDPSVTWASSDPTVAKVNENGFVTAVAAGTANITATAGEQSAVCEVTVAAAAVPEVDFAEPCVLAGKVAHLEGAIWKNENYKLYGDGGHNKNYGNAYWTINVTKPCIVSGVLNGVEGGHIYGVDLYKGEELIGSLEQPEGKSWSAGEIALDGTLTIPAEGIYTIKLRNTQEWSSGKAAGVTLTYVSDLPQTLYLKLSEGDGNWASWPAKYAIYYFDEETNGWSDFMTAVPEEENIYVGTIPAGFADDKIIFVRLDGEATVPNWDDKWSQTVNLEIPEDKDFFTVTSGGTGSECNGEWSKYGEEYVPVLPNGFYLVGTLGGEEEWEYANLSAAKKFAATEVEGEYTLDYTLAAGDRFKAVYVENDNYQTWYPEGTGNDYVVTEWTAGEKTIYFRPTYHEAWGGHFYIQANEPVVTYSDFEIDLRQGQLGSELQKYLTVGETYVYANEMPIAYNALLKAASFNGTQHGYVDFVATIPVEAGNYKITIGNCNYNKKNGAVKNADGTETLDLIDKNGQTITAIETPNNCYHQNTTENVTSVWFVAEADQTIQIVCPQYAPYIKVEQVDEVPEEVIVYTVTFAHAEGATGALPANLVDLAPTTAITLPKNTSMYKEGYTFDSWTDGEDFYHPGFEYEVTDDVTFTAVYAENTVSLAGRTEAVTIKWEFSQSMGVAPINVSGKETFVVAQATIGESKIDVKLPIDATAGKFVNSSNSWTQINPGVIFSIPSAKGAVITYKQYDNAVETTPEINVSETDATYQLVAEGTPGQLYYEYVQVALPKPTATSVENVEDGVKAQKLIENGQMVIIKNGVRYNAQGAVLK